MNPDPKTQTPEPRWPALLAILTTGLLYAALPQYLFRRPALAVKS